MTDVLRRASLSPVHMLRVGSGLTRAASVLHHRSSLLTSRHLPRHSHSTFPGLQMRGTEKPKDMPSRGQHIKEPINKSMGVVRAISAPTADIKHNCCKKTSPGHATSSLKCKEITVLSFCCIHHTQAVLQRAVQRLVME